MCERKGSPENSPRFSLELPGSDRRTTNKRSSRTRCGAMKMLPVRPCRGSFSMLLHYAAMVLHCTANARLACASLAA